MTDDDSTGAVRGSIAQHQQRGSTETRRQVDARFDSHARIQRRLLAAKRIRARFGGAAATPGLSASAQRLKAGAAPTVSPYGRRRVNDETTAAVIHRAVEAHPAWPWLSKISGITPALVAPLLAILDARKAAYPSAFWAFCGLAGNTSGYAPPSGLGDERIAMCHTVGAALVQSGSTYAEHYRSELERLHQMRAHWPLARKRLTAMRKMEKLFLAHLWLVWRQALDLPVTEPQDEDRRAQVSPWDMVR